MNGDVFMQKFKGVAGYGLILVSMYFIIAAINSFTMDSADGAIVFSILGVLMFAAGIFLHYPRIKWYEMLGFIALSCGVWFLFRGIFNGVGLMISRDDVDMATFWQWTGMGVAAIAIGWAVMFNLINTNNKRLGTLIMLGAAVLLPVAITLSSVSAWISLPILIAAAVVFAVGYRRFDKKEN